MTKQEELFDMNWKEYIVGALSLYIASENWECNPKKQALEDYKKFKNNMRHLCNKEKRKKDVAHLTTTPTKELIK